jgi:transketolase
MTTEEAALDQLCINTLRFLAVDMVQKAKSGHPGTPMGAATRAYVLWDRFLKHNPRNPQWADRDCFILSPGHASALLYSLLYLTGYDLSLEDLKQFRQWGSKTPGHPEYRDTPGVEVTTGPLGQGFAHGIGMAIAERWLANHYNRPGNDIINHYTYAIVSDGDMQEGLTSEAASLAGTLRLGKLIYLYDDNDIQLEGSTNVAFGENVARRFDAYGWQVIGPIDGFDVRAIDDAIRRAQAETAFPSLIICKTVIGYGSPAQATAKAHGEPLGEEGVRAAKQALEWPQEPTFYVPDDALAHMRKAGERGSEAEVAWNHRFEAYRRDNPAEANELEAQLRGDLPSGWDEGLSEIFPPASPPMATRNAAGQVLNVLARRIHALTGGSADVSPSTKTTLVGYGDFGWKEYCGHNMHFGVREHAMGAIVGGMALHGGVIPYAATFFTFSDYMRPPMRLAALMGIRVVYIFTHDSIGMGEDGPTHQPIEQLMNLRVVPNLVLTRQNVPVLDRTTYPSADGLQRGGYILWENASPPQVILLGTSSEVHIALEAGKRLAAEGVNVRVVSLPSWELFDRQPADYRERVLPSSVRARVAVEAGTPLGWEHYVGLDRTVIGMRSFGASAPAEVLYEKFGITAEHVVQEARNLLGQ